jgi:hypothetical protein
MRLPCQSVRFFQDDSGKELFSSYTGLFSILSLQNGVALTTHFQMVAKSQLMFHTGPLVAVTVHSETGSNLMAAITAAWI